MDKLSYLGWNIKELKKILVSVLVSCCFAFLPGDLFIPKACINKKY